MSNPHMTPERLEELEFCVLTHDEEDELIAEVRRCWGVIEKLPRTADGVPIVPPMKVYVKDGTELEVDQIGYLIYVKQPNCWGSGTGQPDRFFYSTREAALTSTKESDNE